MRMLELRKIIQGTALAASLTVAGVAAPSVVVAQTTDPVATQPVDDVDDDMDWGWIGLLGLAGLLGLRRRDHVHRTDTTAHRPMT